MFPVMGERGLLIMEGSYENFRVAWDQGSRRD
jgi:hypothetical protein